MRRNFLWLAPLAASIALSPTPAQASILLSVQSVSAAAGSIGDFFDVTITNTGSSSQNIAGFFLGLSAGSSHISFTGANESTALTYLFNGDSFDVINSETYTIVPPSLPGQSLEGSDFSNSGHGTNLAANATLGLGRIHFDVSGDTPAGAVNVALATDCSSGLFCTSLSDSAGSKVLFTVASGTINVTTVAPEPSTWFLALTAIPFLARTRLSWKRS